MMKKEFFIVLILLLGFACENPFSPPVVGPGTEIPIAAQTDPDSVLKNFRYSYEYRDIITYENCLHKEFVFSYIDQDELTGELIEEIVPRDGVSGDIYRTNRVFEVFDHIQFQTWNIDTLSSVYDSTTQEEIKIRKASFYLVFGDIDGDYNYEFLETFGFARFEFKKSEDGFWRMSYWEDNSIQGY